MAERVSGKLNFPNDHFTHDTVVEWWYFFGKFSNEDFFHLSNYRLTLGGMTSRATHWSIHNRESRYYEELSDDFDFLKNGVTYMPKGDRFHVQCEKFSLTMYPNSQPMIHEVGDKRNYYSIPSMLGEGLLNQNEIKSDVWMDHEFTNYKKFSDWDWVGVKLDCGLYIMVHNSETDKRCAIQFNDKMIDSDFILEGKHLFIHALGMYVLLEPRVDEKVFSPRFGIPYSEQPFNVMSKGGIIGTGMREKTYKEIRNGS